MRRILSIVAVAGLVGYGYSRYQAISHPSPMDLTKVERESGFQCDGRTRCSQMTSCAEATYFIQHCPGAKMDGDNDGIPCEHQWCAQ